jgi:cyclophilin family peptidyl-prolyl cis-trans isomerase
LVEVLEGRQLLASLATIEPVTVPALMGYQLPLDGSGTTDGQTFNATSSNPDITVSVAQGPFWTIKVSHQASTTPGDVTFTDQPMIFQLFPGLTPNTVNQITSLTNSGFYVNQGMFFPRILKNFAAQGGSTSATSTPSPPSSSGVPSIATEIAQQLAFNGSAQLAMANSGTPTSTQAQFFVTFGAQTSLDYNYSLFGQLVGVQSQNTLTDLSNVTVHSNGATPTPEISVPDSQVTITSATLTPQTNSSGLPTNPNGVLLINTTRATAGQTATITVTATDPTDGTKTSQTFTVTVGAYNGPTSSVTAAVAAATPQSIQLSKTTTPSNLLDTLSDFNFSILTQPAHGTISQFNPTAGTLVYTPNSSYAGPDSFQYQVIAQQSGDPTNQAAVILGTVNLTVAGQNTGAVHLIDGDVLVVTPLPRTDHGTDNIRITQVANSSLPSGQQIVAYVNGVPDNGTPEQTPIPANSLLQIIVFGGKASTDVQVDSNVNPTIPITLDGGHGGDNVIQAGAGPTREHGWFGHTLLIGGTGQDAMIGRKGFVRFKPTPTTNLIYAGNIKPRFSHRTVEPTGTFYRFEKGRLVPVLTT